MLSQIGACLKEFNTADVGAADGCSACLVSAMLAHHVPDTWMPDVAQAVAMGARRVLNRYCMAPGVAGHVEYVKPAKRMSEVGFISTLHWATSGQGGSCHVIIVACLLDSNSIHMWVLAGVVSWYSRVIPRPAMPTTCSAS